MSEEDGMDDWAAAMAEQADAESESEGGDDGVRVAELDELSDDAPITQEEKKKLGFIKHPRLSYMV